MGTRNIGRTLGQIYYYLTETKENILFYLTLLTLFSLTLLTLFLLILLTETKENMLLSN